MGVYSEGKIYGVSFMLDGETIFQKVFKECMNSEDKQEVDEAYNALTSEQREKIHVYVYASCASTYVLEPPDSFMAWFPTNYKMLGLN
jgi:hypothetical protein